jgi:hypothetical protein
LPLFDAHKLVPCVFGGNSPLFLHQKTKVEDTEGVRGKAAVQKLNKNFEETNISKKEQGGRTAIQSYSRLKSI